MALKKKKKTLNSIIKEARQLFIFLMLDMRISISLSLHLKILREFKTERASKVFL